MANKNQRIDNPSENYLRVFKTDAKSQIYFF